jgi:hypothetical protein
LGTFQTAFEIDRWSNGGFRDLLIDLAIGIGALVFAISTLVVHRRKWQAWLVGPAMVAWAAFWMHWLPHAYAQLEGQLDAYRNGRYEIVEGEVRVGHRQPRHGHTGGDQVEIGGQRFVVDYYLHTAAYRDTIAHDGVLTPGAYARVYHRDGQILRVDVRKP